MDSNDDYEYRSQNQPNIHGNGLKSNSKASNTALLATVPLLWGTYSTVAKYALSEPPDGIGTPPIIFNLLSYVISVFSLVVVPTIISALFRRENENMDSLLKSKPLLMNSVGLNRRETVAALELGLYLFLGSSVQIIGIGMTNPSKAAFLVQTTTVLVPILESILPRGAGGGGSADFAGPKISPKLGMASGIAFLGLALLTLPTEAFTLNGIPLDELASMANPMLLQNGGVGAEANGRAFVGDLLILLSAVFYSFHVVRLGHLVSNSGNNNSENNSNSSSRSSSSSSEKTMGADSLVRESAGSNISDGSSSTDDNDNDDNSNNNSEPIDSVRLARGKAVVELILSVLVLLAILQQSRTGDTSSVNSGGGLGQAWSSLLSEYGSKDAVINFIRSLGQQLQLTQPTATATTSVLFGLGPAASLFLCTAWNGALVTAYTIWAQTTGQRTVPPTEANLIYTTQPLWSLLANMVLLGPSGGLGGDRKDLVGGAAVMASLLLASTNGEGEGGKDAEMER